ncbi:hypothetical protein AAVH_43662, partial [Aphelenchoides avenae]
LLPCRAHYASDAVCIFCSLSGFGANMLHRALTEVFTCNTLVFAYYDERFDANAALEWLLHTHGVDGGMKHLRIGNVHDKYSDVFPRVFIVAIEQ